MTLSNCYNSNHTIEDLPDEVLEFILEMIPPYKDLHDCMVVCKRWRRCVLNVTKSKRRNLNKAIAEFNITWESMPEDVTPTITKRYSHAAAVYDNSMYIYGGCTCRMTTFNDLWRLDLSKRQWVRPLTLGEYPSPKACGTMICYKDCLVLFGGCRYPPSYPLHQNWHLFNELHCYNITINRWTNINTKLAPPPTAGHAVSTHGKFMVIFGGLQKFCNMVHSTITSDVWKLNLETWTWSRQYTQGKYTPTERYGHSQVVLDEQNLLIIGGSGGQSYYFSDAWVLNLIGDIWMWKKVEVRNKSHAPINLWCNPVCKVGDKVIVLNRSRHIKTPSFTYYSKGVWVPPRENEINNGTEANSRIDAAHRQVDNDENVNGRRGTFKTQKRLCPDTGDSMTANRNNESPMRERLKINDGPSTSGLSLAAFNESNHNQNASMQQRRQENIRKAEEKWKKSKEKEIIAKNAAKPRRNVLAMYVLDISHALDEKPYVTWLPLKNDGILTHGPEETVLYTLVEGKSELVMFGGIRKEASTPACTTSLSNQMSNSVHFITAPRYVI